MSLDNIPNRDRDEAAYKFAERMFDLGEFLIKDDKHDIGRFAYRNIPHYYHGRLEKDHPSPLHHWIYGVILITGAELLGTFLTLKQMRDGALDNSTKV